MRVDQISGESSKMSKKSEDKSTKRYTVHNVNILDASGSMAGSKYKNGIEAINSELKNLKESDLGVDYTCTVIEFDDRSVDTHYFMTSIEEVKPFEGRGALGMTPLYQTIGETIEKLLLKVKPNDRVIMTITTDGAENKSRGKWANAQALRELMEKVKNENNFTITFMGTDADVNFMINNMGISKGNTLAHKNTGDSIKKVYKSKFESMVSYSKDVSRGLAVTDSFFKNTSED